MLLTESNEDEHRVAPTAVSRSHLSFWGRNATAKAGECPTNRNLVSVIVVRVAEVSLCALVLACTLCTLEKLRFFRYACVHMKCKSFWFLRARDAPMDKTWQLKIEHFDMLAWFCDAFPVEICVSR